MSISLTMITVDERYEAIVRKAILQSHGNLQNYLVLVTIVKMITDTSPWIKEIKIDILSLLRHSGYDKVDFLLFLKEMEYYYSKDIVTPSKSGDMLSVYPSSYVKIEDMISGMQSVNDDFITQLLYLVGILLFIYYITS